MIVVMNVGINIGALIHFQIKEEMFEFLCSSGDDIEAPSSYCSRSSCTLDSNASIDSSIEDNTEPTADSVSFGAG